MRASPILLPWAWVIAMTACFTKPDRVELGDGGNGSADPPTDTSTDTTPIDGPVSSLCFGKDMFTVCLTALPTGALSLPGGTINTDEDECTDGSTTGVVINPNNGGPKLCVLAGTTVTVTGAVSARGDLPLVIIATAVDERLTVMAGATINVSSRRGQTRGAGSNFGGCPAAPNSPGTSAGGGGGSFGTQGGNGGIGGGGNAGTAGAVSTPSRMRGGCAGQTGGAAGGAGGEQGDGGGAVYLIANGTLVVTGEVNASGAGGGGGQSQRGGGGGGGSGGLIALYGRLNIDATGGQLWANGGGGGGGASNAPGSAGGEATVFGPASGGIHGGNNSSDGGVGATGATLAGSATNANRGAGGGGGGVGAIKHISGTLAGGTFSPDPSI